MKVLVVIDMQNDFLTGALANKEGVAAIPNVRREIEKLNKEDILVFTRDTHQSNYLKTQEGVNLPVEHCIEGTWGHEICDELKKYSNRPGCMVVNKPSFGCYELGAKIEKLIAENALNNEDVEEIELVGVCTDICVISNAMILKAYYPEVPVKVVADACAGVTPVSHNTALEAMKACQIKVM